MKYKDFKEHSDLISSISNVYRLLWRTSFLGLLPMLFYLAFDITTINEGPIILRTILLLAVILSILMVFSMFISYPIFLYKLRKSAIREGLDFSASHKIAFRMSVKF